MNIIYVVKNKVSLIRILYLLIVPIFYFKNKIDFKNLSSNLKYKQMENEYITTTKAKEILKVSFKTISRWAKTGKINFITAPSGRKRYNIKDIYNIASSHTTTNQKQKICYCRVSSAKQMDDLKRQQDFFREKFPSHKLVTDVGSGINWKRKGLKTILEQSMQGNISEIVVAHRDRLCRFAFELLEWIFSSNGIKLVVLNEDKEHSTDQ